MSVKAVEKRRKRSWSLYLILRKDRYKTWITSDEALFLLSFATVKTKQQKLQKWKNLPLPEPITTEMGLETTPPGHVKRQNR
ncbi:hypothetical protein TNCV_825541 [Trichonephila clavipes]|nr:hypothetical protein TNCV_825541 [Trichonephila clavipes]